jgi:hypothetical protein
MNKSILKHETRSMKWILLLSILVSLFLTIMFSLILDGVYGSMFLNGIEVNQALIQRALRDTSPMILILFTIVSVIQVFIQFRTEKDEEIKRFLKSLPIGKEEFFKVKLSTGIINITLAFIVLTIGIIIVRMNNMFWIKDVYSISIISEPFIKADGIASLLKEIGLIYLIILSFYTFLFMVQYTFTNLIGGIVTGILVWLAPGFIAYISLHLLNRFIRIPLFYNFKKLTLWLIPWIYSSEHISLWIYDSNGVGISTSIRSIENLWIKYIICLALIIINIIIGHKFNKNSKVENENMIIPFKITRNIFKIGVTICSGLLVFVILSELMQIKTNNIYIPFILLGGAIGYFISKKITKVGIR